MKARRHLAAIAVIAAASFTPALSTNVELARAGTLWMTSCSGFADPGTDRDAAGLVWQGIDSAHFSTSNHCPQGGSFQILPSGYAKTGENVQWHTVTPPSVQIVHAWTPVNEVLMEPNMKGDGYSASFFWAGGTQTIWPVNNCCGGMYYGAGINRWLGYSRWFGWQVTCSAGPCGAPFQILNVRGIQLVAIDDTPPNLVALGEGNLWYQTGRWIRGSGWPASFQARADDGICGMQAIIDGAAIPGPSDPSPNQHSWTQCPDPQTMGLTLDTTKYADGPMSLTLSARDAASPANVSSPSETLYVDNQPVGLALSGPSDAPSTAGTQYVTASASAGPSQVAGINCSTDNSPYQWHPGTSTQIPVAGIGEHQVNCYAQNNAIDPHGNPARSPLQMWKLKIGEPTALAVGFRRVVDALRCHHAHKVVKIPAHWITIHYHHKLIHVHRRAHYKVIKVIRCHPRTALRQVTVWKTVKRHGKKVLVKISKLQRVVLLPHIVNETKRRVAFGHGSTVSGWLGTTTGTALAGQPIVVLTAPDNGLNHFHIEDVVTTASDGSWTAPLHPGPSRLIEAISGGSATTESTISEQVKLTVPAKILVNAQPTHTHWGATIHIQGRVLGGYIPPGKLLRLRIGAQGISGTVGIPDLTPNGRFHTTWTFARGNGTVTYWFSVSTFPEAAYAYAPASSRRVYVTVGP